MYEFKKKAPHTATRERVRQAFSHLVISDRVMDQLGPAINAGHSMFVYGPPGNGKTVISQAIQKLLDGDLHIPHALEVEGAIIRLFDPVDPRGARRARASRPASTGAADVDRRWVRCRRPMVMVGGELTLESLELSYNPTAGFYKAPVQAVANGGVLVIDDFGRQRVAPRDLLNRWIVPLESRVDFLTLQLGPEVRAAVHDAGGVRHQHPAAGAGRRGVPAPHPLQGALREPDPRGLHRHLPELLPRRRASPFDRDLVEDLLENYYKPRNLSLRGCHPRDLIEQSLSLAEYLGDAAGADPRAAARRLRQLLRGRHAPRRCPRCSRMHDASVRLWFALARRLGSLAVARGTGFRSALDGLGPQRLDADTSSARHPHHLAAGPHRHHRRHPHRRAGHPRRRTSPSAPCGSSWTTRWSARTPTGPPCAVEWTDENPFEAARDSRRRRGCRRQHRARQHHC